MKEMKASAPESGFDRLREAMTDRVQKQELPGMVILVDRGEDVQVETISAMAFESQDPMRRDTIFRITSMTKPILATAAMMLVEDGKLTLGEPVDRWLRGDLYPHDAALACLREQTADRRAADAKLLCDFFLRSVLDVVQVGRGDDERAVAHRPSLRPW